jgi:translation initiation factor 4G
MSNDQSSTFVRLGRQCYNAFRRAPAEGELDYSRSLTDSKSVYSSMISDVDVVHAALVSQDAVKDAGSPSISPRSTDAGCSTPSTHSSFGDAASTDSSASSESESEESNQGSLFSQNMMQTAGQQPTTMSVLNASTAMRVQVPMAALPNSRKIGDGARLQASPNSWAAQQKKRKGSFGGAGPDAEVVRNVRSVLNKLTPERFDSLYEKVVTTVQNPTHTAVLVREIFEKAIMQHIFIGMYVDLCVRLESDVRLGEASFRRILLGQCQCSFEELLFSDGSNGACPAGEEDEARMKCKHRAIGNVKLIGQLLVQAMLSSKLLLTCSEALLSEWRSCPEALESLACLLTVAGQKFDQADGWPMHRQLENVFSHVRFLSTAADVTPRIRYLLRDLLELRAAAWMDSKRATTSLSGPTRLEEVREDTATAIANAWRSDVRPQQVDKKMRKSDVRQPKAACNQSVTEPCVAVIAAALPVQSRKSRRSRGQAQAKGNANVSSTSPMHQSSTESLDHAVAAMLHAGVATSSQESQGNEAVTADKLVIAAPLPVQTAPFEKASFRRELVATLKELSSSHDVAAAVRRIRAQAVPVKFQATEFADMLVRAAEENRGPARRYAFAFIAGLGNGEHSAFDKEECINGIKSFFLEDFEALSEEVPKLASLLSSELVPTLRSVFPPQLLDGVFPKCLNAR